MCRGPCSEDGYPPQITRNPKLACESAELMIGRTPPIYTELASTSSGSTCKHRDCCNIPPYFGLIFSPTYKPTIQSLCVSHSRYLPWPLLPWWDPLLSPQQQKLLHSPRRSVLDTVTRDTERTRLPRVIGSSLTSPYSGISSRNESLLGAKSGDTTAGPCVRDRRCYGSGQVCTATWRDARVD